MDNKGIIRHISPSVPDAMHDKKLFDQSGGVPSRYGERRSEVCGNQPDYSVQIIEITFTHPTAERPYHPSQQETNHCWACVCLFEILSHSNRSLSWLTHSLPSILLNCLRFAQSRESIILEWNWELARSYKCLISGSNNRLTKKIWKDFRAPKGVPLGLGKSIVFLGRIAIKPFVRLHAGRRVQMKW